MLATPESGIALSVNTAAPCSYAPKVGLLFDNLRSGLGQSLRYVGSSVSILNFRRIVSQQLEASEKNKQPSEEKFSRITERRHYQEITLGEMSSSLYQGIITRSHIREAHTNNSNKSHG